MILTKSACETKANIESKNGEEFSFQSNLTEPEIANPCIARSISLAPVDFTRAIRKSKGSPRRNNRLFDNGAIVASRCIALRLYDPPSETSTETIDRVKGFPDRFERNVTISFSL